MKNILLINAHPYNESFVSALTDAYEKGAKEVGAVIQRINLNELNFSLNLERRYEKRTELEPDLVKAQDAIRFADHIVFISPTWWGTFPALLKGFIDRVFLPGFAFSYRKNSLLWDKHLKGKFARIITTMDAPDFFYRLAYGSPGHRAMKRATLKFSGIKPVNVNSFHKVRKSTEKQRKNWLNRIESLAQKDSF